MEGCVTLWWSIRPLDSAMSLKWLRNPLILVRVPNTQTRSGPCITCGPMRPSYCIHVVANFWRPGRNKKHHDAIMSTLCQALCGLHIGLELACAFHFFSVPAVSNGGHCSFAFCFYPEPAVSNGGQASKLAWKNRLKQVGPLRLDSVSCVLSDIIPENKEHHCQMQMTSYSTCNIA